MDSDYELATRLFEVACETNLEAALGRVLDLLIQEAGASRGFLVTPGSEGFELRAARRIEREDVTGPAMQPSRTLIRRAVEAGAPVRIGRAQESTELSMAPSVAGSQVESLLAVPILTGERLRAVACLDSTLQDAFSGDVEERVHQLCAPLGRALAGASRAGRVERQQSELSKRLGDERGPALLGEDPVWLAGLELIRRAAATTAPILLRGETGTGKEQVARAVHAWSTRAGGPFVAVDCGALSDELLEAELFGHEQGAFTGASRSRPGLFATAHGGTVYLDGVDELSKKAQGRFLRVLETGQIQRLGSDRSTVVDVRIVASLLPGEERCLRDDLRFRLAVLVVDLPPLRERGRDVLTLAEAFLLEVALRHDRVHDGLDPDVVDQLLAYTWPGNVRELRNVRATPAGSAPRPQHR